MIPNGICQCGCGRPTAIIKKTQADRGRVAGEYSKYAIGHGGKRKTLKDCIEICYRINDKTGCWDWQKDKMRSGYGRIYNGDDMVLAHRYMWEQHNGNIRDGFELHHLCGNRGCCNPKHLIQLQPREHRLFHGELSDNTKRTIVKMYFQQKKTQQEIADILRIGQTSVSRTVRACRA